CIVFFLHSWLLKGFWSKGGPRRIRRRTALLSLETLEDRRLLAGPPPPTIWVTTAMDDATNPPVNSLRWAIKEANDTPGGDIIRFDIANAATDIELEDELPSIYNPVVLDAATTPDGKPNQRITLE